MEPEMENILTSISSRIVKVSTNWVPAIGFNKRRKCVIIPAPQGTDIINISFAGRDLPLSNYITLNQYNPPLFIDASIFGSAIEGIIYLQSGTITSIEITEIMYSNYRG